MSSSDPSLPPIHCEVVYATAERQYLVPLTLPAGTTALGAVTLAHLPDEFPDDDFEAPLLGVFSTRVEHDYVVKEGDRIEVYRPLTADPKEVRRQLAAAGLSMGVRGDDDVTPG